MSQEHYQISADKNLIPPPEFKVGDQAYVKAQFFQTTQPAKELSEKYLGPYEIINQAGPLSWTLHLPEGMCAIHPVFHVSMLEPSIMNSILNHTQPPSPPSTLQSPVRSDQNCSELLRIQPILSINYILSGLFNSDQILSTNHNTSYLIPFINAIQCYLGYSD